MAILGISTNTRLLGIAIIDQNRLVDYSIRLHKSSWSASKANMIVTSLEPCVRRYCINKVVLSIPHEYHQTKAFRLLQKKLCRYFEKKNIPVITTPPETFLAFCPTGEKKVKKMLMKVMVERFPELNYCYHRELRNKNRYYIKLFEAIAVAALNEEL